MRIKSSQFVVLQVTWRYDQTLARPDRAALHFGFLPPARPGLLAGVDLPGYSIHQSEYPPDDRAFGVVLAPLIPIFACMIIAPMLLRVR